MSDSVWPHRRQPTRLPHPLDSPGKNTGVGCHFLLQGMQGKSESEVAQSCPTGSNPMDCSLPGSSVHGIFQARVPEWGAIAFSMTNLDSILKSRDITLPTKICIVKAVAFPVVTYGSESWTIKKAEHQKTDALHCGVGEKSWESLGLQGDQTSPSYRISLLNIHWKDWCWNSNTLATWCEELTHLKRPWCWERLKAGGEGDDRGRDDWIASPTRWTRVWENWVGWWTGKHGKLRVMGLQSRTRRRGWTGVNAFSSPACVCAGHSVMPNSATPSTVALRLRCPCDFPDNNIGVGCHFLLQGIFTTQGTNPGLLHCRWNFTTEPPGKPRHCIVYFLITYLLMTSFALENLQAPGAPLWGEETDTKQSNESSPVAQTKRQCELNISSSSFTSLLLWFSYQKYANQEFRWNWFFLIDSSTEQK